MPEGTTAPAAPKNKGGHRATYARDKRHGGYIIRVTGPTPEKFAGRDVPVERSDHSVGTEKLTTLITSGIQDAKSAQFGGVPGEPYALYHFAPRPREEVEEVPF